MTLNNLVHPCHATSQPRFTLLQSAKNNDSKAIMIGVELYRMVIATYGYKRIGERIDGIFDTKEQALKIRDHAVGVVIPNDIGLGWPRAWRIVSAEIEEHSEGRGAVVAGCEAVEEQ